jgi:transposase InsO family protein
LISRNQLFVLDALEQVLYEQRPLHGKRLAHHGDSYDNAIAETVIGLFKTELIWQRGSWRNVHAVEFATLEWGWFNNRCPLGPISNIPSAEAEARYYEQLNELAMSLAQTNLPSASPARFKLGAVRRS